MATRRRFPRPPDNVFTELDEDDTEGVISRDTRQLSNKPEHIRARLRRRGKRMGEDLALLHEQQGIGWKPVKEWDFEELLHGKPRNVSGNFKGRRPDWITPLVNEEVARRLREETTFRLNEQVGAAVKVLAAFLKDEEAKPELRLKAATLVLEYVVGKPEQKINVEGNVRLQAMLASALVLDDGTPAHPMIEGVVLEMTDDESGDEL